MPDVISNQIIIDTLAIGNSADSKLRQVALDTGGSSYFFSTSSQNSTALLDALVEPFTFATKDPSVRVNDIVFFYYKLINDLIVHACVFTNVKKTYFYLHLNSK